MPELLQQLFTVAEYIELLNTFLKREVVRLSGEVTQVQRAASGHVYFTVKDPKEQATLSAVIWKFSYLRCGVTLEQGMQVILTGTPSVYAPTGRLSFVADTVELTGEGALKNAYDELKKKLTGEGLFAPERKRQVPELARTIGVVTSREGAVIHDFFNNLGKYGYDVRLADARVEGQQAVGPLLEALETLRHEPIEALVVIRGGGSLESLQAFNNEMLVRALVSFPVPVIAGIGHDQDVPLAALAADATVSTPTAAAHLLNRSWDEAHAKLRQVPYLVERVGRELSRIQTDLTLAWESIVDHTADAIRRTGELFATAERTIRLSNPERQLHLGYAIARKGGKVVKSTRGVVPGDELAIQLSDGTVDASVTPPLIKDLVGH
ncbi:MAG: exodeoxyribonuclease VII large subunit [bacterium]|nr:exodeoxyribonuclease VII large subunit [bacterium]